MIEHIAAVPVCFDPTLHWIRDHWKSGIEAARGGPASALSVSLLTMPLVIGPVVARAGEDPASARMPPRTYCVDKRVSFSNAELIRFGDRGRSSIRWS